MEIQRDLNRIVFVALFLIGFACSSEKVEREYYESGKLKIEWEIADGSKNGVYKEYYQSGRLKKIQHWNNGQLHGKATDYDPDGTIAQIFYYDRGQREGKAEIFYSTGEKLENQYYKDGKMIDYERFEKNGKRSKEMLGLAYFQKDSVLLGSDLRVQFRLGNVSDSVYQKGRLIITSKFDQNGNPTDTIDLIESHNNSYNYIFEAKYVGLNHLKGCLQYIIPLDTVDADLVHQYCFEEPYFVKDLK